MQAIVRAAQNFAIVIPGNIQVR